MSAPRRFFNCIACYFGLLFSFMSVAFVVLAFVWGCTLFLIVRFFFFSEMLVFSVRLFWRRAISSGLRLFSDFVLFATTHLVSLMAFLCSCGCCCSCFRLVRLFLPLDIVSFARYRCICVGDMHLCKRKIKCDYLFRPRL